MQSILRPLQLEHKDLKDFAVSRRKREIRQSFHQHIPWKEYLFHLPVLLLGVTSYGVVIFIFGWVEPSSIQNLWVANSYAPLLLTVAVGTFLCSSYFFLNSRRGLLLSAGFTAILFLKLQQVLTGSLVLIIVGIIFGIEGLCILLTKVFVQLKPHVHLPNFLAIPLVKSKHRTMEADFAEPPEPHPPKHGRKRKHHFFGK